MVVVVDACNLTRNLVLVGELLAYDEPVVVALNMVDLAQRRGLTLDAAALSKEIGCSVVPIVARRGEAVDRLTSIVADVLKRGGAHTPLGLDGDQALEAWADKAVAASVTGVGSGGDSLTQRSTRRSPPDPRHPGLRRGDGRHVLDAVRAGAAADGPDRSGVRAAGRG